MNRNRFTQSISFTISATVSFFVSKLMIIKQKKDKIKLNKRSPEFSHLKARINPHFLFNTLNNIYSLSICKSEYTPEAILKLTDIMRYTIEAAEENWVPLEKEIQYIGNYIALQKLRNNDKLKVTFNVDGDIEKHKIAPLILINFIENAFKHGISNHLSCFIIIKISVLNNQLTLSVDNKKMNSLKKERMGVGINYAKRALQLQYPGDHHLTINDQGEYYKIKLVINLI
ncbi:MAG: histidine kinase [Bacteroidota bacterium]|nr:histidine kinase [Bacteroidota bacterium]